MSEMIERVAMAIEAELYEESPKHIWANRIARAAIEAMNGATEEMLKAGVIELEHYEDADPTVKVANVYWEMMDAALELEKA